MSELKLEFVGKKVKDMYGTYIGKGIGIVTDIEGSIESVSVDCGSSGIKNLPYEQLLVQGDYVIFIPRWRLDAQKLLREKSLALKRIKALQEIVAENDSMKDDAEFAYLKYEKRLDKLGENTKEIIEKLHQRISELDMESKRIRSVLFDAKLQYKSNEITEDIFQQISLHTNELLDHINLEKTEIKNIMNKLAQQTIDNALAAATSTNNVKENAINTEDENNEISEEHDQIPQELNNNIDHNQELKENGEGEEEVTKESENPLPEIINTNENENERNEINPMITSTN
jgi:methyl-accepting chemotaxis protein